MPLTGARYRLLHQRTDEILHYVWDPIGVADSPEARDEYSGFVPRVVGLLAAGAGAEPVADYLLEIEKDGLGLTPAAERAREVANLLVRWRDWIDGQDP